MRVQNCNQPVLPAASHQCNQKLSVGKHHFSACGQQRSLKNLCLIFCRNFNLTSAHNCRPVPDTKRKKLCFNRYMWIWKKKNWSSCKTSNFRGKGSEGDFLPKFFGMFCEIFSVLESSDPLRCGWDLYKKSDFFDFKMLGSIFLQLQFSNREFLHNINSVLCNKLQCKS